MKKTPIIFLTLAISLTLCSCEMREVTSNAKPNNKDSLSSTVENEITTESTKLSASTTNKTTNKNTTNKTTIKPKTTVKPTTKKTTSCQHVFEAKSCKVKEVCNKCGIEGSKTGSHSYKNYVCTNCGTVDESGIQIKMPKLPAKYRVTDKFHLYIGQEGMIDYIDYTVVDVDYWVSANQFHEEKPYNVFLTVTLRLEGHKREFWGNGSSDKETKNFDVAQFNNLWVRLVDSTGETEFQIQKSDDPAGQMISKDETKITWKMTYMKADTYTVEFFDGIVEEYKDAALGDDTFTEWYQ